MCVLGNITIGCASDAFVCACRGVCMNTHMHVFMREEREREGDIFSCFSSLPSLLELIVFFPFSEPGKETEIM